MHNQIVSDPATEFKARDARPERGERESDIDFGRKLLDWAQFRAHNHHLSPVQTFTLEETLVKASDYLRGGDILGCVALCDKVGEEALAIRLEVGAQWRQRVEALVPYLARLPERSQIGLLKCLRFFSLDLPSVNPKVDHLARQGYVVFRYLQTAVSDIERHVALLVPKPTLEVTPAQPEETEELYGDVSIRGRAQRVQITRMRNDAAKVRDQNLRAERRFRRQHAYAS